MKAKKYKETTMAKRGKKASATRTKGKATLLTEREAKGVQRQEGFGMAVPIETSWATTNSVRGRIGGVAVMLSLAVDSAFSNDGEPRIRRVRATIERVLEPSP